VPLAARSRARVRPLAPLLRAGSYVRVDARSARASATLCLSDFTRAYLIYDVTTNIMSKEREREGGRETDVPSRAFIFKRLRPPDRPHQSPPPRNRSQLCPASLPPSLSLSLSLSLSPFFFFFYPQPREILFLVLPLIFPSRPAFLSWRVPPTATPREPRHGMLGYTSRWFLYL